MKKIKKDAETDEQASNNPANIRQKQAAKQ
jgi:hypothetical protein